LEAGVSAIKAETPAADDEQERTVGVLLVDEGSSLPPSVSAPVRSSKRVKAIARPRRRAPAVSLAGIDGGVVRR
jgi:hypothetical protein